eukprot:TRINITY_DN1791_c0_g1_i4.p1 TRINITY_DN1791_c0_g1~~TRINITY_DN1791_c0_g1_i4.p1  ORF type:complete len:472 (+),score=100.80 TRINITY_DN1791_c0_g1_i4:103-1416(+)
MAAFAGTPADVFAEVPSVKAADCDSDGFDEDLKPGLLSRLRFTRTYSGNSTEVGDNELTELDGHRYDRCFSDDFDEQGTLPPTPLALHPPSCAALEHKLQELKALYKVRYGQDVDEDSDEDFDLEEDQSIQYENGVKFVVTHGAGPQLCKVEEKYADGVMWTVTRGRPLSLETLSEKLDDVKELLERKCGPAFMDDFRGVPPSYETLEAKLDEVKALFNVQYGQDVDDDCDEDDLDDDQSIEYEDGIKYIVTHGAGPQPGKVEEKFVDGINWIVTRGRPLSADSLFERLDEVKELYTKAHGGGTFDDDESRDAPPSFCSLQQKMIEVKHLFKSKYGVDIDDEDSDEETELDDDQSIEYEDGVKFIVTHGAGPQYGKVEEKFADGIMWTVTRGRPLSIDALLERLDEVKEIYADRSSAVHEGDLRRSFECSMRRSSLM